MFKNHPKGLIGAALSNMGERFGFYIMMAILLLFLNNKFGFTGAEGSIIYSVFYALIYVLSLVGGIIADKTKKYKTTILCGLVLMSIGYLLLAIPTPTPVENMTLILIITCLGLFSIAFGNGLFKGNLQAVVGQLYDDPKYADKRETGFQLFYMFINIGAMFAPLMAVGLRNWYVQSNGFTFNADLPALCNQFLSGNISSDASARFAELAAEAGGASMELAVFAKEYLNIFMTGYHYSFGIAIFAMLISLAIFLANRKTLPDPGMKSVAQQSAAVVEMDVKEVRQRIYALFAVFAVVIFFWFSFHQNGQTLTLFANDYTRLLKFNLGFTVLEGAEVFQTFNPLFVVFLTPVVIGFFGWLKARGIDLSTPKKIAIGMGIAATAFAVMALGSFGLPDTQSRIAMGGLDNTMRVTPWLLIGTYLILTIAELFISPLGIAFVSKVAPPKYQGVMQGGWLTATALGNQLLFIGVIFYNSIPIWATWCIFVVACLISMFMMLGMLKWLERVAK
ncbi:peptide MFS transporter [Parabacteroides sp. PF5-6]|uniref:peptide MFS transporter n=1 Tax=Parabacteroides sp. PF5-6 TaxID=1742403 RepID=UPI0024061B2D|nr:peptide MFS transporter [Parabacteroides sp. PF5-6]MDF9830766.1 POT family proton-dependent oligopeptide transporter [Parabacteroides sp. PF5-6]